MTFTESNAFGQMTVDSTKQLAGRDEPRIYSWRDEREYVKYDQKDET